MDSHVSGNGCIVIKKAHDYQGLKCISADRTGKLNLILTYPNLMKPSNIKGLVFYCSYLNISKLTKIGGSSYRFCYIFYIDYISIFTIPPKDRLKPK